jgi:hypothetical protein
MADILKFDDISKLQTYEDYIANNITEWEAESIARVCRKIGKIGKMSKKELEKFDADKEAKKEWERIVAALAIATALNIRTLKKAYISEFEAWEKQNEYLYQYRGKKPLGAKNKALQGIIEQYTKQNAKDIVNLTNTKALSVLDRNGNPIRFQDAIYKSFGDAIKTVTEGKADFYTTMRQTVQNLGGGGCKVNYGGDPAITRRLDTVVRQNMLYGIKQANNEYNEAIAKELNCDGYEVDAHNNPRQSHYFMQGKQYCIGKSRTINGIDFVGFEEIDPTSPDGLSASKALNDYGCRHYKTPIICGVSEPRFSKEQLAQIEAENKKQYTVGDLQGNKYYFSQKMRALETEIRKAKDEINALKAFGNREAEIKALRQRIKTVRAKYNEIAEVTGISAEPKRLSVPK